MGISLLWCCRSTQPWNVSIRRWWKPRLIWAPVRWPRVFRVIVPLSRPGIVAGSVLVFIPCLGAYLTPDLLGGGRTVLVGNLVQNQFTNARDWPFGSAVSMLLMVLVMVLVWGLLRRESEQLA